MCTTQRHRRPALLPFAHLPQPQRQVDTPCRHGGRTLAGNDQILTIDPCLLRYVYQGMDLRAGNNYLRLPWRMGLLTQTNPTC